MDLKYYTFVTLYMVYLLKEFLYHILVSFFPLEKHFKSYFLCKAFSDFRLIDIILSFIDVML